MLFNTIQFIIFFLCTTLLYFQLPASVSLDHVVDGQLLFLYVLRSCIYSNLVYNYHHRLFCRYMD